VTAIIPKMFNLISSSHANTFDFSILHYRLF